MFTPISLTYLSAIVSNTPSYVWFIFIALAVLGGKQLGHNHLGIRRVVVMPLVMVGLSVWGTVSAFGLTPAVLLAWVAAFAATGFLVFSRPAPQGVTFNPATARFSVPGSAVPLALMMGIFSLKYVVGIALAIHPEVRHDATLTVAAALAYGAFSGTFAARAARLIRLAYGTAGSSSSATRVAA